MNNIFNLWLNGKTLSIFVVTGWTFKPNLSENPKYSPNSFDIFFGKNSGFNNKRSASLVSASIWNQKEYLLISLPFSIDPLWIVLASDITAQPALPFAFTILSLYFELITSSIKLLEKRLSNEKI